MTLWDRILLAGAAGCVVTAGVAGWLMVVTPGAPATMDTTVAAAIDASPGAPLVEPSPAAVANGIVVDVEGGVTAPGLHRLAPGARVGDAIAAAGGYGPAADLTAAARALNLAAPLEDGQQIYVPMLGEPGDGSSDESSGEAGDSEQGGSDETDAAGSGGTNGGSTGGLVDLNTASPEELDALPGIGPATVQKIVAGRQERPFSSLQDAVDRKVLNRGQLEKISDLATAG